MFSIQYLVLPKFSGNLTCEQDQRTVTCNTHATGYSIKYQWFINNELLTPKDGRVVTLANAMVTLNNLTSQDKWLTVRVSSIDSTMKEHSVTQSAALLVMTTPCSPTSQGITGKIIILLAKNTCIYNIKFMLFGFSLGACLTVIIPVVVTLSIILLLVIVILLICFYVVCQRRKDKSRKNTPHIGLDATDSDGGITRKTLTCFSNEHKVLEWLHLAIFTVGVEVKGNENLRQKLEDLLKQLENYRQPTSRRVQTCGDCPLYSEPEKGEMDIGLYGDEDKKEQEMIQSMISHLKNILSNE